MKPTIECKNFEPPENLVLFMKEAIGDVLKISPYDSYLEAYVRKELADYLMTISINHPGGKFDVTARDTDLRRVITQGTNTIFNQVRSWWRSRFVRDSDERTDWAGDFSGATVLLPGENDMGLDDVRSSGGKLGEDEIAKNLKKPLRVLVVDDDMESAAPLELCLEKLGCETFVVSNGFEAIYEMVSNHRVYDVVILDWNMPEMNGGQALRHAQRVITHSPSSINHWAHDKLPVITYSSRAREEIELPECKDFKYVAHWEKPSSYLHLLNQATETLARLE